MSVLDHENPILLDSFSLRSKMSLKQTGWQRTMCKLVKLASLAKSPFANNLSSIGTY